MAWAAGTTSYGYIHNYSTGKTQSTGSARINGEYFSIYHSNATGWVVYVNKSCDVYIGSSSTLVKNVPAGTSYTVPYSSGFNYTKDNCYIAITTE